MMIDARAGTGIAGRHYFLALIGAHPPVQTLRDLPALRAAVDALRSDGRPIALVPTMGALHDGHMALVEEARRHGRHVVVSIFVNPRQFGPDEDLDAYPRREAKDAQLLQTAGVAILWAPSVDVMYHYIIRVIVSNEQHAVALVAIKVINQNIVDILQTGLYGICLHECEYISPGAASQVVRLTINPRAVHGCDQDIVTKSSNDPVRPTVATVKHRVLVQADQYIVPDRARETRVC